MISKLAQHDHALKKSPENITRRFQLRPWVVLCRARPCSSVDNFFRARFAYGKYARTTSAYPPNKDSCRLSCLVLMYTILAFMFMGGLFVSGTGISQPKEKCLRFGWFGRGEVSLIFRVGLRVVGGVSLPTAIVGISSIDTDTKLENRLL